MCDPLLVRFGTVAAPEVIEVTFRLAFHMEAQPRGKVNLSATQHSLERGVLIGTVAFEHPCLRLISRTECSLRLPGRMPSDLRARSSTLCVAIRQCPSLLS